jgi:hypothetical protein
MFSLIKTRVVDHDGELTLVMIIEVDTFTSYSIKDIVAQEEKLFEMDLK